MATFPRRLALLGAVVVAVPLLAALPIGTAQAAPVALKVNIYSTIFNPANKTIEKNSTVQYVNKSGGVVVVSYSSNWPGSPAPETLPDNGQTVARKLTAVGIYTVSGTLGSSGTSRVTVVAAGTKPSPTPKPTATTTSPAPRPSATTTTSPPTTEPTPSTGTATAPPIGPTSSASARPTSGGGTLPSIAPLPTADPPVLAGGSKRALLQPHPVRRLGLPGALSVVLVLGLLLGLGRVLLAMAPPRAQRS